VWCPKCAPLSSSCFIVTTAMIGFVLLQSVVVRHRVMSNPGGRCIPDPCRGIPRHGTNRHARATLEVRGCGTGARSQPAYTDCGTEFTPLTCVLLPRGGTQSSFHPQMSVDAFPWRRFAR